MVSRAFTLLLLLSFLYTSQASQFRHVYRQDPTTDGGDGTASVDSGDDGSGGASAAASSSPDVVTDAGSSVAPAVTDTDASAAPAASASSGSGTSGLSSGPGVLAGAGTNGGAVPSNCYNCENTYSLINTCSSEGSSESCSPICSGWSSTISCLNCLLLNGQQNLNQSAVQQVVWNLEASCGDVGISVSSATISATATTTGPFTTPSAATQAPTGTKSTSTGVHSGLTVYNDNTRLPAVTASVSQIGYVASGADQGVVMHGAAVIGVVAGAVLMLF